MDQAPRTRLGRRERHRQEVRQRILQAAVGLFGQHGFNDTTVEQITEAADVAKGTFFNYFKDKGGLLRALVEMQRSKLQQGQQKALDPGKTTYDVVAETVHDVTALPARSVVLFRSVMGAVLSTPAIRQLFHELLDDGIAVFTVILERGQKRGEVRADKTAAELARALQNVVLGAEIGWALQTQASLPDWLDKSLAIFWDSAKSHSVKISSRDPGKPSGQ